MALTPEQKAVLVEWIRDNSPEDVADFVEATSQSKGATLKAYAKVRVDALKQARDLAVAAKGDYTNIITEKDEEIAKFETVKGP